MRATLRIVHINKCRVNGYTLFTDESLVNALDLSRRTTTLYIKINLYYTVFGVMEAIPLNNVIICIDRLCSSSADKKLPNVIFHRFNAFWLFSFTQTNRAECQKVKWNANEKLSLSISHSHIGILSLCRSQANTHLHFARAFSVKRVY